MPENREIRYHYKNRAMSGFAAGHIFRYLSAFGDYEFVEDKSSPVIWRDEDDRAPESARIILSCEDHKGALSIRERGSENDSLILMTDAVERIYNKISVAAVFGPYGEIRHKPDNDLQESLGGIILDFYQHLNDAGIIDQYGFSPSLWPDGKRFALALTHDVDIFRRTVRGGIRLLFKRDVPGGLRGLGDSIKWIAGRAKNPYDGIHRWIELERKHDIKSTFFLFSGNRKNKNDPKYELNGLRDSLEHIRQNGYSVALHTGIECYRGDNMEESRELLNRNSDITATGVRPHYLSASLPDYWLRAAGLGFDYSSCLGFDDDIGFYRGIDLPFIPFNAGNNTTPEIVEIPIGIMDCGLINEIRGSTEESLNAGKKMINRVKNVKNAALT